LVLVGALLTFGLTASTSNAAPAAPPDGHMECTAASGLLKFGPALKSTLATRTVRMTVIADSCDVGDVTGGSAPIVSAVVKGTSSGSINCASLGSSSALTMQVTTTFRSAAHGNGAKVGSSTGSAQFTFAPLAAAVADGAGAFAGAPLHLDGALFGYPDTLAALCASPFGLSSAQFTGSFEIGDADVAGNALTGFTVDTVPVAGCVGIVTGFVTLSAPAPVDTFVSITSSDPASLVVDSGGATVPAGSTSAAYLTTALAESPSVTLSATLGLVTLVQATPVAAAGPCP
jgi:hypothetical protein